MPHNVKVDHEQRRLNEQHIFTRTVVMLAIITAVLYLRAIAHGGFFGRNVLDAASAIPVMAVLLLLSAAGLILAWCWEWAGGIVATLEALALAVFLNLALHSGQLLATLVYSSPFLIGGGMCLLDWWRQRHEERGA